MPGSWISTLPAVGRITTLSPTSGCGAGVSVGRGAWGSACRLHVDRQLAAIVNVRVRGESAKLPTASVERTVNRYAPAASPSYRSGEAHATNVASRPGPSSRHVSVRPSCAVANVNVAAVGSVAASDTSGAAISAESTTNG